MIPIRHIENNPQQVIDQLSTRGNLPARQLIDTLINKNHQRKKTQTEVDTILQELKQYALKISNLLKSGDKKGVETYKQAIQMLKKKSQQLSKNLKTIEEEVQTHLLALPNLPHPSVPKGKNYSQNIVITSSPTHKTLTKQPKPHWELLDKYHLASFQQGSIITGTGFPVYHGKGARLQRALINFFLDEAVKHGYQEVQTPLMVNKLSAFGTGQLPDKEKTMYVIQDQDFYMIPTAEVPITNLYRHRLLNQYELPIKHVAYTPCFRQEAGSWGRHVRGLNRLHQFDKVELVHIETQANSEKALQAMCQYITKLLDKLQLTYRILKLCTGELGFTSALTYDIEVWSAGQKKWLEVSSISLCTTFQARRMHLRYLQGNEKLFCHTLNGSALALPRLLAALLEHYQTETNIQLPAILHSYVGFTTIT